MLEVKNLSKKFDDRIILDNINYQFEKGKIYGLIGINGAGKSTLLRTMSGIYKATNGVVEYNGLDVYDNEDAKRNIFYIPDENPPLIEPTIDKYIQFFECVYGKRNVEKYEKLKDFFKLDTNKKITKFSKGMKKQAFLFINLCFDMEYLFLDETFEGVDPVIRVKIKKMLLEEVEERSLCLIISSHNINDLESICDDILMINGTKLENNDIERENMFEVQIAFKNEQKFTNQQNVEILKLDKKGDIYNIIVKGDMDTINEYFESFEPIIYNIFSLSAEEVLVYKVEGGKFDENTK